MATIIKIAQVINLNTIKTICKRKNNTKTYNICLIFYKIFYLYKFDYCEPVIKKEINFIH